MMGSQSERLARTVNRGITIAAVIAVIVAIVLLITAVSTIT